MRVNFTRKRVIFTRLCVEFYRSLLRNKLMNFFFFKYRFSDIHRRLAVMKII
jgi:hypothetical protein